MQQGSNIVKINKKNQYIIMCLTQSHSINKQPSPSLHYLMRENKATFMVILTNR